MSDIDPSTIHCPPGRVLVRITERLERMSEGGIILSEAVNNTFKKDTAYGVIIQKGVSPGEKIGPTGIPWTDLYAQSTSVGDIVVFPRDIPLAFDWDGERYGIVYEQELMFAIDPASFDPVRFEVLPWRHS